MHYYAVRDLKKRSLSYSMADIISDIMKQEEKVIQAKHAWIVDIAFYKAKRNTLV